MAAPCWCESLLPAPEGVTDKFGNFEVSVLRAPESGGVERVGSVHGDAGNVGGFFWHTVAVGLGASDSSESTAVFVIIDGDELLVSATTEVLTGTGADIAMHPVVLDNVNASRLVLTAADDNTVVLLETADTSVEVLVCPAVLEDVSSDPSEVALVFVIIDGDELLDSTTAKLLEVLESTGVDIAMNPVVLNNVKASTLVQTAVDEDNVQLLEAADTDVEVLVYPAVLRMSLLTCLRSQLWLQSWMETRCSIQLGQKCCWA